MTGRGFRGRQVAQMMLSAAILFVGFEVFLLIAAPACGMCPMYSEPPAFAPWLSPASGVAIGGFGLGVDDPDLPGRS